MSRRFWSLGASALGVEGIVLFPRSRPRLARLRPIKIKWMSPQPAQCPHPACMERTLLTNMLLRVWGVGFRM